MKLDSSLCHVYTRPVSQDLVCSSCAVPSGSLPQRSLESTHMKRQFHALWANGGLFCRVFIVLRLILLDVIVVSNQVLVDGRIPVSRFPHNVKLSEHEFDN